MTWWNNKQSITFLFGTGNWIRPYFDDVIADLQSQYDVRIAEQHEDMVEGDIAFFLGYPRIIAPEYLALHKKNYVVHASDLPKGRGMSPWVWDVLNGADHLTVTMLEAVDGLDEGDIIYKDKIDLDGGELIEDLRALIGHCGADMASRFLSSETLADGTPQQGEPTYYKRRYPKDSELAPSCSIEDQFNLLRVVDNNDYPAFFIKNGIKYILKIEKAED